MITTETIMYIDVYLYEDPERTYDMASEM